MKASFIRIAITKAPRAGEVATLENVEALASQYEECERNFASAINESKARRGEGPVRLRKRQREVLEDIQQDQIALDEELGQQLQALDAAQDVVQALHFGMQPSIETDRKSLRHYHADELPIGRELLGRKEALVAALAGFLAERPNAG